jgi:hypothetical protein
MRLFLPPAIGRLVNVTQQSSNTTPTFGNRRTPARREACVPSRVERHRSPYSIQSGKETSHEPQRFHRPTLGAIVGAVVGWTFLVAQLAQQLQAPGIV